MARRARRRRRWESDLPSGLLLSLSDRAGFLRFARSRSTPRLVANRVWPFFHGVQAMARSRRWPAVEVRTTPKAFGRGRPQRAILEIGRPSWPSLPLMLTAICDMLKNGTMSNDLGCDHFRRHSTGPPQKAPRQRIDQSWLMAWNSSRSRHELWHCRSRCGGPSGFRLGSPPDRARRSA
jgi:hypothetical protein